MYIRFEQTRRNHGTYVDRLYMDRLYVDRLREKYNYMVDAFYQTRPEDKEKLKWIHKLDTIPSIVTTAWNKIIIIAKDTNIGYKKLSDVLEKHKEVINTYYKANPSRY